MQKEWGQPQNMTYFSEVCLNYGEKALQKVQWQMVGR